MLVERKEGPPSRGHSIVDFLSIGQRSMGHLRVHQGVAIVAAITVSASALATAQPSPSISLLVTPSSGIASSGDQGGPFVPAYFHFRVSSSSGTIRYAITPPFWLTANPRMGTASTDGVMITFMVNGQALKLSPAPYETRITFTNVTNGQGTTSRPASLTVHPSSRGYLLDDEGKHLFGKKERLLAR
jgi:hypothetical protein